MGLMRPKSKGRVALVSSNPLTPPSILYNYLLDKADRDTMINGIRKTREMAEQPAFNGKRLGEILPGPDVNSNAELYSWLKESVSTEYHPCSTCRMGSDESSVTDETGRVHLTNGLRVVDASIFPSNVTANLNAPVLMVAEKLADVILGNPPLAALNHKTI